MKKGKILALDFGTRSVGIAISDVEQTIAFPRGALKNDQRIFDALAALCEKETVATIVLGLPRAATGKPTRQTIQVQNFAALLKSHVRIPIVFQDERFTTQQAAEFLKNKPKKIDTDSVAASLILAAYLDLR